MGLKERASESTVLAADGQISPVGVPAFLKSYVGLSAVGGHTDISFENGSGGSEKWADAVVATTADGDGPNMRHTFGGRGLYFSNDIYMNLTNCPKISAEWVTA